MTRWLETDSNTNLNIASATEIGAYTANADRLVLAQAFIDQAAGNGDYVFYATLQVNGSGSAYRFIPITTANAASGVTALGAVTGFIPVRNGDVVKVFVDGLAGDTTTPDTTVRWFEMAALRPATADRTIAVDASGQVTPDAVTAAPDAATVAAAVRSELATELARVDATVSSRLAASAYSSASASAIADAVWDEMLSGHTTVGSAGKIVGDFEGRLNATVSSIQASLSNSELLVYRGDSWTQTITGLGNVTARTKLYLTVKAIGVDPADSDATIQIEETDGLVRLNGAASDVAYGSIVVDNATLGNITLTLTAEATAALKPNLYTFDVQMVTASGVRTLGTGTLTVTADVTRTTS